MALREWTRCDAFLGRGVRSDNKTNRAKRAVGHTPIAAGHVSLLLVTGSPTQMYVRTQKRMHARGAASTVDPAWNLCVYSHPSTHVTRIESTLSIMLPVLVFLSQAHAHACDVYERVRTTSAGDMAGTSFLTLSTTFFAVLFSKISKFGEGKLTS